jgi:hypothetical protein
MEERRRPSRWWYAQGFFALPYTIIVYPLVFLAVPRL